jgi:L-ornithine Nalpha-acyltransferase
MAPENTQVSESIDSDGVVLDTSGTLEARLATTPAEIEAAQRLRFDVFYREMSAKASPEMEASGRDFDKYDAACEHLIVIDRADAGKVIATYRLMGEAGAARVGGFYTAGEYDIAAMLKSHAGQKLLELGRSCVLKSHRNGPTMQLLWRGLLVYLIRNDIDLMFGCASLPGTDPAVLKLELAYLHHFHSMPEGERVRALPQHYTPMNVMPKEAIDAAEALRELPPLVKGYVRMGALIGDGAVIDHQFDTTDVFIYFPIASANPRWIKHLKKKVTAGQDG